MYRLHYEGMQEEIVKRKASGNDLSTWQIAGISLSIKMVTVNSVHMLALEGHHPLGSHI